MRLFKFLSLTALAIVLASSCVYTLSLSGSYNEPISSYGYSYLAPTQSAYSVPVQSYGSSYSAPVQSYGSSYSPLVQTYQQPIVQTYQQPLYQTSYSNYSAPVQSYGSSYSIPLVSNYSSSYVAPTYQTSSYSAPVQSYGSSYSVPVQSYSSSGPSGYSQTAYSPSNVFSNYQTGYQGVSSVGIYSSPGLLNGDGTTLGAAGSTFGGIGSIGGYTSLINYLGGSNSSTGIGTTLGGFGGFTGFSGIGGSPGNVGSTGYTGNSLGTGGYVDSTTSPSYGSGGFLTGNSAGYGQIGNYGSSSGVSNGYQSGYSNTAGNIGTASIGYGNYTNFPGAYGSYSYGYPNNLNSQVSSSSYGSYGPLYPQVNSVLGIGKRNLTPEGTGKPTVDRLPAAASYSEPVFSAECPTQPSDYTCPQLLSLTKDQLTAKICEYDAVFTGSASTDKSRSQPTLGRRASDRCSAVKIVERASKRAGEARFEDQDQLVFIVGKECQLGEISKRGQVFMFVKSSIPSGTKFAVIDGTNMDLMSAQSISKEEIGSLLESCENRALFRE